MTIPQTTMRLMKVTYPNGIVAYAPVFLDGYYYGKADVDAGRAVAEPDYSDAPLDRYYEWASHTPDEMLVRIEDTFSALLRILESFAAVARIVETLSTSEVFTHFRRWSGHA